MNNVDVVNLLRKRVKLCGNSQSITAFNLGISRQYLNDILHYKREPGVKVLKAMGLRKKIVYEKIDR